MKRNVLLFISLCVVGCVMTYAQCLVGSEMCIRDSVCTADAWAVTKGEGGYSGL